MSIENPRIRHYYDGLVTAIETPVMTKSMEQSMLAKNIRNLADEIDSGVYEVKDMELVMSKSPTYTLTIEYTVPQKPTDEKI